MRIQHETVGITDEAEKAAKIELIKADVERFRAIVLQAEDVVEIEPAKGAKPAKTVNRPGGHISSAPNAMNPAGSRQPAARRSGRQAIRPLEILSVAEDDLMPDLWLRPARHHADAAGLKEGEAIIHP